VDWDKIHRIKDKVERYVKLSRYHEGLKKQRLDDKAKIPTWIVSKAARVMRKGKCPYCKKKLIEEKDGDYLFRKCRKHGFLQRIKKVEQ